MTWLVDSTLQKTAKVYWYLRVVVAFVLGSIVFVFAYWATKGPLPLFLLFFVAGSILWASAIAIPILIHNSEKKWARFAFWLFAGPGWSGRLYETPEPEFEFLKVMESWGGPFTKFVILSHGRFGFIARVLLVLLWLTKPVWRRSRPTG